MPQLQQIDTRPIYDENLANFGNSFLQELNKHSTRLKDEEVFSRIPGYETEEDPIKQLDLLEKNRNKFSPEYLKERRSGVIERAKLKKDLEKADEEGNLKKAQTSYYNAQATKAGQPKPEKPAQTPEDKAKGVYLNEQAKIAAKTTGDAKKKLSEIKGNQETIDELRRLNKKLKGPAGYAKILSGSEDAATFNALGHSLTKVPLSIFNPQGPVAVAKVKLLKEIYAVTASERHGTIEGKLKAAEWMNKMTEQAQKHLISLYDQYNGMPPQELLDEFNTDFERTVIDPALAQSFQEGAEQMVGGFYSQDGRPLKPMPKSKAMDLMEKGLIFNERPKQQ